MTNSSVVTVVFSSVVGLCVSAVVTPSVVNSGRVVSPAVVALPVDTPFSGPVVDSAVDRNHDEDGLFHLKPNNCLPLIAQFWFNKIG